MSTMYNVTIEDVTASYPDGTSYDTILKNFYGQERQEILNKTILVQVNGNLQELFKELHQDCTLVPVPVKSKVGYVSYRRSCIFMMVKAIYDLLGSDVHVRVEYSLGRGVYCILEHYDKPVTEELLNQIRIRMQELRDRDIPFVKKIVKTRKAQQVFHDFGQYDKEQLFRFRLSSYTSLYELDGYQDYYYGYMAKSTGILKTFDLVSYKNGFLLLLYTFEDFNTVAPIPKMDKVFGMLEEATRWGRVSGIETVGDLNQHLVDGIGEGIILVQEAMHEKKIGDIAAKIASDRKIKFVLVAGPSSSGKTSFANRLSVELYTMGLTPHPISVDNYFVNRTDTPVDENGDLDFECLEAVDTITLNRDLKALLDGEEVEMPRYNFTKGEREYKGDMLKLGDNDILVIEGIHSLNDKMTFGLPRENKFKIYISALLSLNIDEHNMIPTTDARLMRRIVRDARTRGMSAKDTIAMWPSVRRGEERNIFPYQETADVVFNSSLIYELAVEKQYCEMQLYSVPENCPEYLEAKRLLKFLNYVLGYGSEKIPNNSIVREFVGGSCFDV